LDVYLGLSNEQQKSRRVIFLGEGLAYYKEHGTNTILRKDHFERCNQRLREVTNGDSVDMGGKYGRLLTSLPEGGFIIYDDSRPRNSKTITFNIPQIEQELNSLKAQNTGEKYVTIIKKWNVPASRVQEAEKNISFPRGMAFSDSVSISDKVTCSVTFSSIHILFLLKFFKSFCYLH
jgi:hypothetical protein